MAHNVMLKSYFIDEEKSELHKLEICPSKRSYIKNEKEDENWSFISSSTSSLKFPHLIHLCLRGHCMFHLLGNQVLPSISLLHILLNLGSQYN